MTLGCETGVSLTKEERDRVITAEKSGSAGEIPDYIDREALVKGIVVGDEKYGMANSFCLPKGHRRGQRHLAKMCMRDR